MKNKTEFSNFFQQVCGALGISSQQELAKVLGVNRSAITQAKQRNTVPDKWLHILARDYALDPSWLAGGPARQLNKSAATPYSAAAETTSEPEREDFDAFCKVPKVSARLCAGGGSFEVDGRIEDYYAFKRNWLQRKGTPGEMVLMDVFGNSMEPEIKEGDTVLLDQLQKSVIAGGVYAVGVEDTVMVKRVEKRPNALALLSDNKDYSPIILQGDELENVRIIGKVVWICREYR